MTVAKKIMRGALIKMYPAIFLHKFIKKGLTNSQKFAAKPLSYNLKLRRLPMNYSEHVKRILDEKIHELSSRKDIYCKRPGVDFSRNKKLDFEKMLKLMISMEGGTLNSELLKYFDYSVDSVTASAFVRQCGKIKEEVFVDLFHQFNNSFPYERTFNGYQLVACDGSHFNIYNNPSDPTTYYQTSPERAGYNMMHLDACYDLCNRK